MAKPSQMDQVADRYVQRLLELSPTTALDLGVALGERTIPDFSAGGAEQRAQLHKDVLKEVQQTPVVNDADRVTADALRWYLSNAVDLHDAGLDVGALNNIDSPIQEIRDPFTVMDMDSEQGWQDIIRRVEEVPAAYETYIEGLDHAMKTGHLPTRVQVEAALAELKAQRGAQDPYRRLMKEFQASDFADNTQMQARLDVAVAGAQGATRDFTTWLAHTAAPRAVNEDAVGRDVYRLCSASFLGKHIDPAETYEWALEELVQIHARQQAIVDDLFGSGTPIGQAMDWLNNDPAYQVHGTGELIRWMERVSGEALDALAGTHFTISEDMRKLDCMISPAADGGIFYTAPSEDFSRPGAMWWAVPPGVEVFHTWQEKTTAYHEGVPGHHLQLGRAVSMSDELNRWRRSVCWFSGHGEGWALYAEAFMKDLGFLSDPADELGMLDAQRLRTARVLVDIGLHVGLPAPSDAYLISIGISPQAYQEALDASPFAHLGDTSVARGVWDRNDVWAFMRTNVAMDDSFLTFEATRYLGWPGQASSYKVGQRVWEDLRDRAVGGDLHGLHGLHGLAGEDSRDRTVGGNSQDVRGQESRDHTAGENLRVFHDRALALGSLPLAVLEDVMSGD